ncbi:MAG: Phosphohexose isomerase, partial [Planctomycetota bacterium]
MVAAAASFMRCDEAAAWPVLHAHFDSAGRGFDLRRAFQEDPERFDGFSQRAPHVFADLSKNLIDRRGEALLMDLARQCGLPAQRDAMFRGDAINTTEDRAVLHYLLRYPSSGARWEPSGLAGLSAQRAQVQSTLEAMLAYAERVRADAALTDIVHIGIGGSDLGPQMAVRALAPLAHRDRRLHFVSNVDGHELEEVLRGL